MSSVQIRFGNRPIGIPCNRARGSLNCPPEICDEVITIINRFNFSSLRTTEQVNRRPGKLFDVIVRIPKPRPDQFGDFRFTTKVRKWSFEKGFHHTTERGLRLRTESLKTVAKKGIKIKIKIKNQSTEN